MRWICTISTALILILLSCGKDNGDSGNINCNNSAFVEIKRISNIKFDATNHTIIDTSFYWETFETYVMRIEIKDPNQNKPFDQIYFKNPLIVSINFGVQEPIGGEYTVEPPPPFINPPFRIANPGKASVIVDGNFAVSGKVVFEECKDFKIASFKDMNILSPNGDTLYSVIGQITKRN